MADQIKLMMTWDILPGKEEDYFEFHIRNFVPTLEKLGLSLHEAWLTVYGERPRLMAEAVVPTLTGAKSLLHSKEWETLGNQLEDLVENFEYKLIPFRTRWQM